MFASIMRAVRLLRLPISNFILSTEKVTLTTYPMDWVFEGRNAELLEVWCDAGLCSYALQKP